MSVTVKMTESLESHVKCRSLNYKHNSTKAALTYIFPQLNHKIELKKWNEKSYGVDEQNWWILAKFQIMGKEQTPVRIKVKI